MQEWSACVAERRSSLLSMEDLATIFYNFCVRDPEHRRARIRSGKPQVHAKQFYSAAGVK